MTQQNINIGTVANDGTGDPLRTAFMKADSNFSELYTNFTRRGSVTLTNGVTSTTVTGVVCSNTSVILLIPKTADAAASVTNVWVAPGANTFIVHHANNTFADKTFGYFIL